MDLNSILHTAVAVLSAIVILDNALAQIPAVKSNSTLQAVFHFVSAGLNGLKAVDQVASSAQPAAPAPAPAPGPTPAAGSQA